MIGLDWPAATKYFKIAAHERMPRSTRSRSTRGSYIAEFPVVLWILFVCVAFPLITLATITLRMSMFSAAAKDAAHAASKAETFATSPDGKPTALQLARTTAVTAISHIAGVRLTRRPVTQIVIVGPIDPSQPNAQPDVNVCPANQRLSDSDPLDTSKYIYQIRVTLTGELQPLIPFRAQVFGNITGLTSPYQMSQSGIEHVEYPQGLKE
jgi:Flp pilus assembly protein TadG